MCYVVLLRSETESTMVCHEGETSFALNSKRVVITLNVKIQIPSGITWFFQAAQ